MQTLILVGYWRNKQEPGWPDPAWFIDEAWDDNIRCAVLEHLGRGEPVAVAAGVGWCRFRCGAANLGTEMRTDGTYVWPASLEHYLRAHAVRPPDAFIEHTLRGGSVVGTYENTAIASNWWRGQQGWRTGCSYLTPGVDGRLTATRADRAPLSSEALHFLRGFPFVAPLTHGELSQVLAERSGVLLAENCDYTSYLEYDQQARVLGLELVFEEVGE